MNKAKQYFNVIAVEGENSADLLIYGYIGQSDWWSENDTEALTDLAVVQKLAELEKNYSRINVRINSPGGSVYHGDAIISAIRRSTADIHTYNDGMAASMAAQIWMASKKRHMASNAKLMIHPTLAGVIGNAKILREEADVLDKFDASLVSMIAENSDMSEEEIKARYIDEYKDNFLTYRDAIDAGFVTETDEYEVENVIKGVEKMNYLQILNHFNAQPDDKTSFLKELKDTIVGTFRQLSPADRHNISPPKSKPMNKQELMNSLQSGEIKPEEVAEVLRENKFTVEPVQEEEPPATVDVASVVTNAINAALKPLQDKVDALQAEVNTIGAKPGDSRTNAGGDADPDASLTPEQKTAKKQLEALNAQFAAAGKNRERIQIS